MKFLFCGLGSIGRRHLNILKKTGKHEFIAYRSGFSKNDFAEVDLVIKELDELKNLNADAALITNPTSLHIKTAIKIAEYGIPMFIEKPLDKNLENIDTLLTLVSGKNIPVLMGYNMIHHPGIRTLKRLIEEGRIGKAVSAKAQFGTYMPGWHPEENYKESYAAVPELGGGVVLTSIHEQNYLTDFFGDVTEIKSMEVGGNITDIKSEEGVEILFKHNNGVVSNIHLNFFQKPYYRTCQIIGTEGTLFWDFMIPEVKIMKNGNTEIVKLGKDPMQLLDTSYTDQMNHFIDVINAVSKPAVPLMKGIEDLKTALLILKEIRRN